MGLFSGGNSKSSSKQTITTTTQNASFSELSNANAVSNQGRNNQIQSGDGNVSLRGTGNTLSILDGGAIENAFKFAESVTATNAGLVGSAVSAVAESRKSESENVTGKAITYFTYAAVAFAAAWAIRGWK